MLIQQLDCCPDTAISGKASFFIAEWRVMEAGEILLRKGLLDHRQWQRSREAQIDGTRLDQAAVQLGFLSEEKALRALGEEVGIEFVDLAETEIDLSLLKKFPLRFIHRENLFPIRQNNGTLVVATSDPFNLYPLDELSVATGMTVVPMLAGRAEIDKLIKTHLGVGSETIEGLIAQTDDRIELLDQIETDGSELSQEAQEPSVVRLVNEILIEALESRASDVHIESMSTGIRVRYRIDGVLHPQPVPQEINRFQNAIISRLKSCPGSISPNAACHRTAAFSSRWPGARSTSASPSSP